MLSHMNLTYRLADRIKIGLGISLLAAVTGCVGWVGGGYGGVVVVPSLPMPEVYLWGGGYERGREVRGYSERGHESRAVAHPSESRAVAHPKRRPHRASGEPGSRIETNPKYL